MRRLLLILFITIGVSELSHAQFKWDIGGSIGAANYLGEIGGEEETRKNFVSDIKLGQTRTAAAFFVRHKFSPLFSLKAQVAHGRIKGADSLSLNRGRVGRNLSFRNDIVELALIGEVYFYNANDVARIARKRVDFRAYGYAGVAGFYHNPKTFYNEEWIALRPLRTEGQAAEYGKIGVSIPTGMGFQYIIGRKYKVGLELGWRTTFTDYLDDISTTYADPEVLGDPLAVRLANRRGETTSPNAAYAANYTSGNKRGDPTHNDSYIFSTINFSYSIRGKNSFYKSRYNYITGMKRKMKKRRVRAKF